MAGSQAASRLVGCQRSLTAPDLLNKELLPASLTAISSIINKPLRCLMAEC